MEADVWCGIWRRLESPQPILSASDDLSLVEPCQSLGILQEASARRYVPCPGCGGTDYHEIRYVRHATTQEHHGFIVCPECGVSEVDAASLRRWRVDVATFLGIVFRDATLAIEACVRDELWRVGRVAWCGRSRDVWFVRVAPCEKTSAILSERKRRPGCVVFTGTDETANAWRPHLKARVLSLESSYIPVENRLDLEQIERTLQEPSTDRNSPVEKRSKKRADRAAAIEALTREVICHLRAARDAAVAAIDFGRTPELLPRPTQTELAFRTGLSKWDVSRCFKDPSARELRLYFGMADDLDRLIAWK